MLCAEIGGSGSHRVLVIEGREIHGRESLDDIKDREHASGGCIMELCWGE